MPTARPDAPLALHLARLAKATPDQPLDLPDSAGALRTVHLTRKRPDEARERWYVCLAGEVFVDLPHGNFVHLHAQEVCRVEEGTARTLTPVGEATLLILDAVR